MDSSGYYLKELSSGMVHKSFKRFCFGAFCFYYVNRIVVFFWWLGEWLIIAIFYISKYRKLY